MSLYTFSHADKFNSVEIPAGLRIERSSSIPLLSKMSNSTMQDVAERLANDNLAFVAYLDDKAAAFGWMARQNAKIGELNHDVILPKGNRYMWNFRTLEAYRGLGIYAALLQYILQNGDHAATRFWIIHAPENNASLKGIQKAGFEYVGQLYLSANDNATIESNKTALSYQHDLEHMGIKLSSKKASSCWNCSSPYLKKRSATCCCYPAGNECIGRAV